MLLVPAVRAAASGVFARPAARRRTDAARRRLRLGTTGDAVRDSDAPALSRVSVTGDDVDGMGHSPSDVVVGQRRQRLVSAVCD